jgi:pimeloyl-ACP methyl ester carboxylesterase
MGYGPVLPSATIGIGHSMGAGLVTVQQARFRSFKGLVLLGRAILSDRIPAPPEAGSTEPVWKPRRLQHAEVEAVSEAVDGYLWQRHRTPWQRYLFYWENVPSAVIAVDESQMTTVPLAVARELVGPDLPGERAAAAIDVPVLLGFGERDVGSDPEAEVGAYRASPDVQLFVLPQAGHCTNLASGRVTLWDRIRVWIGQVGRGGVS